jgi:hypothetical protein
MTCRGYDPKAVKIGKDVKRAASLIHNAHERGAFIRSFVMVAQDAARQRTSRNNRKDK